MSSELQFSYPQVVDTEAIGGGPDPGAEGTPEPDIDADAQTAVMPAVEYAGEAPPAAWRELRQTIRRLARLAVRPEAIAGRPQPVAGLTADPRLPRWLGRAVICLLAGIIFGLLLGWRVGMSIAAVIAIGDTLLRARTATVIPAAIRVTRAQRQTTRRLAVLRTIGYHTLHARAIPGTDSVIDNLVVGPPGVFALDAELWDRRLPIRIAGQMLYHGPAIQKDRLEHARWEAQQAANLISVEMRRPVMVRPAMVIYGPNVPWKYVPIASVDVFGGGWIAPYFRHQAKISSERHLDAGQIAELFAAAGRALPPVAPPRAGRSTAAATLPPRPREP